MPTLREPQAHREAGTGWAVLAVMEGAAQEKELVRLSRRSL